MARTANGDNAVASGRRAFVASLRDLPWPPLLVLVAIILPESLIAVRYRALPKELALLLEVLGTALIALAFIARMQKRRGLEEFAVGAFVTVVTITNIFAISTLILLIVRAQALDGQRLLSSAIYVWIVNILAFSLAYWEMDRGGPMARKLAQPHRPDFIFPEMTFSQDEFQPNFADYIYLAFNTSTAFSATDTVTASTRARMLIIVQALISLITIAVVAARAVNIFPTGK